MQFIKQLFAVVGIGIALISFGFHIGDYPEVDHRDISSVRAHYAPPKGATTDWLKDSTARGSSYSSTLTIQTDWHDADTGEFLFSDVQQSSYSISRSGTVVALPVGGVEC